MRFGTEAPVGRGVSASTPGRLRAAVLVTVGCAALLLISAAALSGPRGRGQIQIPTTVEDYFQPGTQPNPNEMEFEPIVHSQECSLCHGTYLGSSDYSEPWDAWVNSMMGQSTRDPVWHAAVTIANQDAAVAGEFCIRCHAPAAWLAGRSASGSLDNLMEGVDFDGVNCHFCHRKVDPVYSSENPAEDVSILADLMFPPQHPGNARYIVDPSDVRRGPFDDVPQNMHGVPILVSPFHRESDICATCHDVSNLVFTYSEKQGKYILNPLNMAHPTHDPADMMPEQRTYSEWANSQFATTGVQFDDGRFGGNHPTGLMKSCQDCHMPDRYTGGCFAWEFDPFFPRPDMPFHGFNGANTWVLGAVYEQHGEAIGLTQQSVDDARARNIDMLRAASDMELAQFGDQLQVRIINWSGHKLPTGYPEGRRMWLNVKFYNDMDVLIDERGTYDFGDATLDDADTKVYQIKLGMDQDVANATGLSPGVSFHLVLNNYIAFDNRIPPVGFTNAAFQSVQAEPVGYAYDDGEHWDDTLFDIPPGAAKSVVTLYMQTTSREYIEFLRDTNVTDSRGQTAYDLWLSQGKSAPVDLDMVEHELAGTIVADIDDDGRVDVFDLIEVLMAWGPCTGSSICRADVTLDGTVDIFDLLEVLMNWTS